jgi:DNA-binding LacI/PurR family transcriptional regulator
VGLSGEVLVSGCDGVWDSKCNSPEITTIDLEIPHLVETAVMMLHRRIRNPELPSERLKLSAGLIVRESSIKQRD